MNQDVQLTSRPLLLMEGGPLYSLEKRVGSINENGPLTKKRALFVAALTWAALFVLSALQGRAFGHSGSASWPLDKRFNNRSVYSPKPGHDRNEVFLQRC